MGELEKLILEAMTNQEQFEMIKGRFYAVYARNNTEPVIFNKLNPTIPFFLTKKGAESALLGAFGGGDFNIREVETFDGIVEMKEFVENTLGIDLPKMVIKQA